MLKRFTVLVMLAIFLCGCSAQRPMRYTEEHIDKIELVISENAGEVDPPDSVIVCTLTGDEIAGFMVPTISEPHHNLRVLVLSVK